MARASTSPLCKCCSKRYAIRGQHLHMTTAVVSTWPLNFLNEPEWNCDDLSVAFTLCNSMIHGCWLSSSV